MSRHEYCCQTHAEDDDNDRFHRHNIYHEEYDVQTPQLILTLKTKFIIIFVIIVTF